MSHGAARVTVLPENRQNLPDVAEPTEALREMDAVAVAGDGKCCLQPSIRIESRWPGALDFCICAGLH